VRNRVPLLGTLEERGGGNRIRHWLFNYLFVLAATPLVFVGIAVSAIVHLVSVDADREVLQGQGQRLAREIEQFIDSHLAAVSGSAGLVTRGQSAGEVLDSVRGAFPGFVTMIVTDADGRVTAWSADVGADPRGVRVDDRDYFREPRTTGRPHVSGVFQGRGRFRPLVSA
jgi:hypothetical protein